jgi:hypothetical protein
VRREEAGIGAEPAVRASLTSVLKARDASDLAEQLGGGQDAAAAFGEQPRPRAR